MYYRVLGTVLLSALILAALPSPSRADDKEDAKNHFQAGITLLKAEDFKAAAAELEASVKLYPNKNNLYNLANCYRALHRYDDALSMFERLLEKHDDALKKEMRDDTKQQIAEINAIVGRLAVATNLQGARIVVDGEEVGKSPLGKSLVLAPGEHQVSVSLDGYDTVEKSIDIASSTDAEIQITFEESNASLVVKTDVGGASVLVDGKVVGVTPLTEPLRLAEGDYTVALTKEGYAPEERTLTLEKGSEQEANFELEKILPVVQEQPKQIPVTQKVATNDKKKLGPLFWVGLAGTVVVGGVSGAMWGLTVSKKNKHDETVDDLTTLSDRWNTDTYAGTYTDFSTEYDTLSANATDYKDDMEAFNKVAVGTTIGAGVFAVLTIVGAVFDFSDEKETSLTVLPSPGGVTVRF